MNNVKLDTLRSIDELFDDVAKFFLRAEDSIAIQEESYDSSSLSGQAPQYGMSLLEIACLGNPEKTLQGELYFHLRRLNWNIVLELGYVHDQGQKRNPDLGVFDSFGSGKKLICVIELKHFSANQGSAEKLIEGLDSDYLLNRPEVPLMQIGMYTVVSAITPTLNDRFERGIYRFLNTYCSASKPPKHSGDRYFNDWITENQWERNPLYRKTAQCSFIENLHHRRVVGHIEYVIGIRN